MRKRSATGLIGDGAHRLDAIMAREVRMSPNALRRIAIGFGGGFLFSFGPLLILGVLIVAGMVEWPPQRNNLALALLAFGGLPIGIAFFISAFTFVWFFRCPQCRRRINRLKRVPLQAGLGNALRYYCSACDVEWDVGWQERPGDGD
jgi:hypothetical protein